MTTPRLSTVKQSQRIGSLLAEDPAIAASGDVVNLFVSDANGADSNTGLSAASPYKTLAKAYSQIPKFVTRPHVIHLGSGTYSLPRLDLAAIDSRVWLVGDGAGQAGDDGLTEVLASTAVAGGTTTNNLVTAGGLGALHRFTVEFLTGVAAGNRKTIRENDATDISLVANLRDAAGATVVPSPGDTFRVVRPAVILDVGTNDQDLVLGAAGGGQNTPDGFFGLVNVQLNSTPLEGSLGIQGSVTMFGVENKMFETTFNNCAIQSGQVGGFFDNEPTDNPLDDLGAGAGLEHLWKGWSYFEDNTVFVLKRFAMAHFLGWFSFVDLIVTESSHFRLNGGSTFEEFGFPAINLSGGAVLEVVAQDLPYLARSSVGSPRGTINVQHGGRLLSQTGLFSDNTSSGAAYRAYSGGVMRLTGDGGTSSTGIAVDASLGGTVAFTDTALTAYSGGGGDLNVEFPTSPVADTTLAAGGDRISDSTGDGSRIIRLLAALF